MLRWITSSLTRKFGFALAAGLIIASAAFLALFISIYETQLEEERSQASLQVNQLLQASLENAMLKRDLAGLREIVRRLGEQDGIRSVMIINRDDEIRFASQEQSFGHRFARATDDACTACHVAGAAATEATAFMTNEQGHEVLRSVNPVRNKAPCTGCHGSVEDNPVNGVLFVDYDGAAIRERATTSALILSGTGGIVIFGLVIGAWSLMRSFVLRPVGRLAHASRALSTGDLNARVEVRGRDELADLAGTFNDMAKNLQRTMQDAEQRKAFLQALVDAVPDGVRVIDEQFRIVLANQAYCRQIGREMADVLASTCYQSSHGRTERCPPTLMVCPVHEIVRTGRQLRTLQQHTRGDGGQRRVEVYAAPLQDLSSASGGPLFVESIRDLSSQARISQEQRLSELGQLATGVAHEIRNPLAAIRFTLNAAIRSAGARSRDKLYDQLKTMDGEIDQCVEITDRLLKLSVPPSEKPTLVPVNAAITETLSLLAFEAEDKNVTVELKLDPADPRVLASDSEIRMAVLNFVQNAFHAMPSGGRLLIESRDRGKVVELRFEDSGVGIRPDDLPYIYDPFFSRRADSVEGTGLGLTICKAIVERYGGYIEVESHLGRGTWFVVGFPNAEEAVARRERKDD